ncbi:undecaprenyl diphosphate synthase [Natronobacillus azotifigens]|uniref:Isoprenyl transferase n=1 Tax=Natronobacillus azotifigens TaxID=472978 RepID=A0A9J6RB87_9BACI|nr:isoprenyl transferase [Natronobacillus azotifigens]MCZ0702595.1 isoprenyl transferase [Natronobacillus azotifigens]
MGIFQLPFRKKSKKTNVELSNKSLTLVPDHVAIIMDGNGRWANERGLPRFAGHKEGMDNVKRIVKAANKHNISIITMYAFSTENWKRPKPEVDYLLKLPKEFLNTYLPELIEENVQIKTIGAFNLLPEHTKKAVQHAIEKTKANDGLILNIALNYGSRSELVHSVQSIANSVKEGNLDPSQIDESTIANSLYTYDLPDPDLLIRTSGEMRLSNFLLWQSAYTEFWFAKEYWPSFTEEIFEQALLDYQNRKRRFGGL